MVLRRNMWTVLNMALAVSFHVTAEAAPKVETKIYIIRHAETRANSWTGTDKDMACAQWNHSATHLSDRGYQQAQELARFLEDIDIDYVFRSEMFRTLETVEPLLELKAQKGRKLEAIPDPRINNISMGKYECLNGAKEPMGKVFWDKIDRNANFRAPQGESRLEVRKRTDNFLKELESKRRYRGKTILIVGHSRTVDPLVSHFLGLPQNARRAVYAKNAEIFRIAKKVPAKQKGYTILRRVRSDKRWIWNPLAKEK